MDVLTILSVLKELGILNILVVLVILNLPAVTIAIVSHLSIKMYVRREYITEETYKKGVKNFYDDVFKPLKEEFKDLTKSMDKLAQALNTQNETMARFDERFKLMGTTNNGPGAN